MRKFLKLAVVIVVALGVIRGMMRYQQDHGSTGIERVLMAVIDGIADVTYRWVPAILEFLGSLLAGG